MTGQHDSTRVLARCVDCNRTLAGNRWPDGSVTFIGQPDGCPCGGTEARVVAGDEPVVDLGSDEDEAVTGRRPDADAPATVGTSETGEPLS